MKIFVHSWIQSVPLNKAIKSITTGITSSRPTHITPIKTHFEKRGISGDTYPVLKPQVEKADTTSKRISVTE
jgi:hypothetical protein